jgi:uncharacterized protein YoxC
MNDQAHGDFIEFIAGIIVAIILLYLFIFVILPALMKVAPIQ